MTSDYPLRQIFMKEHPRDHRRPIYDVWPVSLYNSGHHLCIFFPDKKPKTAPAPESHQWLPFRRFRHGFASADGYEFVHKGHTSTGSCVLQFLTERVACDLFIPPRQAIWIRNTNRALYVYLGLKKY